MGTSLQKIRDSSKSYTKSPTASTLVMSTHALPFSPSWHKIHKHMEGILIYTELPLHYGTQFGPWMTIHVIHSHHNRKLASAN